MTRPPKTAAALVPPTAAAPADGTPPAVAGLPGPAAAPGAGPGTLDPAAAITPPIAAAGQTPAGGGRRRAAGAPLAGSIPVEAQAPGGRAGVKTSGKRPGRGDPANKPPRPGQDARKAIAAAMSEDRGRDSLDAHVRRLLRDLGLRGYHTHDSRRSQSGFPDWTITGKRTIFRELKTQRGKVSAAQQEWLDALTEAGDDAAVWRPIDLLTGRVARELAAISKLGRAA